MRMPGNAARAVKRTRGDRTHWHSRAHIEWGKERLYFWQLRFLPTYPVNEIKDALEQLFHDARIGSYMVYEVFGDSDLLIRLWLPAKLRAKDFRQMLEDRLGRLDLERTAFFEVDEVLRHWVWGSGEPAEPTDERMSQPPPTDEQIAAVNGGHASAELLRRLHDERLATQTQSCDGIKFAMVVTIPAREVGPDQPHTAQRHLKRIVDQATQIEERSLYLGHGEAASFVILGRVRHSDFDAIRDQLAAPIAVELESQRVGARTYTMVVASWELLAFKDELPLARELRQDEIPLEVALSEPEAARLEVKGSAYLNFRRFLLGDGEIEEDPAVTHAVLKTIVAMLNTDGGTLVLGALEPRRFAGCNGRMAAWPTLGDYVCAGVDHEWGSGWDLYERRLNDEIAARIDPLPLIWLSLARDYVEDRPLARVIVKRPDRNWYYLLEPEEHDHRRRDRDPAGKPLRTRARFYVRQGGLSAVLEGVDADHYKRTQQRWR